MEIFIARLPKRRKRILPSLEIMKLMKMMSLLNMKQAVTNARSVAQ